MKADSDPVKLLEELVAIPTVSHQPVDAIVGVLAHRAEDAGGRVEVVESSPGKSNIVARFGPPGTDGLVVSGHMDVVPTEGQAWSADPFRLTRRDGKLLGRGTADMKGFLAASTVALSRLDTTQLQRELVLIWTHDEEVGCLGSGHLAANWAKTADPLPSQGWIGEPTDMQMCRMHPGHSSVEITCIGRAAHSSRPNLGTNAILIAQRVLAQLESLSTKWAQEKCFEAFLDSPYTVMNIGQITGGTAINIVPEQCRIRVGFRPLPGVDSMAKIDEIKEALSAVKQHARFLGGDLTVRVLQVGPALLTQAGTPLEHHLCEHATTPEPTAAPFATDGGNLEKMGIASIVFGPGSIDVAHRADEFILESDLRQCVSTVQRVVHAMCIADQSPA